MRKVIIAIHGLGNKPDRNLLQQWWKKSLSEGLKNAGVRIWRLPFRLVYWSDILYPKPLDLRIRDEKNPLYIENPYIRGSGKPAARKTSLKSRLYRYLDKSLDQLFEKNHSIINIEAVSNHFIRLFFSDLDVYYSKKRESLVHPGQSAHQAIQNRLFEELKRHRRKRILLIAHSMGSIVSFDVLNQHPSKLSVDTFVTIGSPLGLANIKESALQVQKLQNPSLEQPHIPECITGAWYNLSDPEDQVAMDSSLADDLSPNSRGVQVVERIIFNDYVSRGKRNPHKSYGYLRSSEMAQIIAGFFGKSR